MKKVLTAICSALLIAIFAVTMAGCDKSGSIKKAFEKEEYTVTTVSTSDSTVNSILKPLLTEDQLKKANEYEVILCAGKGLNLLTGSGVVIKFSSSSELKDFLTVEKDGNKDTTAYDKAKEDGRINGNCLYFGSSAGKEIFKKA